MTTPPFPLPKLVATTVNRRSQPQTPGGSLFVIDFAGQEITRALDLGTTTPDERGRGPARDGDLGFRGVAISGQEVYVATSRELQVYGTDFSRLRTLRSPYLRRCAELSCLDNRLYIVASALDSVLAFDLEKQAFVWALHITADRDGFRGTAFDPQGRGGPGGADGPPARNDLGLNSVHASPRGLFVSGGNTGGLLRVGARGDVQRVVDMPGGIHNAQPLRDGVIFNDTEAGALRYVARDGPAQAFRVPGRDPEGKFVPANDPSSSVGFARGLCVLDEYRVAAGSSPSVVTLYDLESNTVIGSVDFSADADATIHSLAVWPFS